MLRNLYLHRLVLLFPQSPAKQMFFRTTRSPRPNFLDPLDSPYPIKYYLNPSGDTYSPGQAKKIHFPSHSSHLPVSRSSLHQLACSNFSWWNTSSFKQTRWHRSLKEQNEDKSLTSSYFFLNTDSHWQWSLFIRNIKFCSSSYCLSLILSTDVNAWMLGSMTNMPLSEYKYLTLTRMCA